MSICALILTWRMPESPKYLVATKQYDKARAVISRIARMNKVVLSDQPDQAIGEVFYEKRFVEEIADNADIGRFAPAALN